MSAQIIPFKPRALGAPPAARPVDLNRLLIRNQQSTYGITASGALMDEVPICAGDLLIVDCSIRPQPDDVVIIERQGEFTVFHLRPGAQLCEGKVWAVITHVIHTLRWREDKQDRSSN